MPRLLQKLFSSEKIRIPRELDEGSLPFQIASNISLQEYNSFIESKEISGYKLDYKKGTVYIVEMCSSEREAVVEIVGDAFRELCPRAIYGLRTNAPIQILAQPLHEVPDGTRRGPDLAVRPHSNFVPNPPVPHPGPPPGEPLCEDNSRRIKLYKILNTRDASGYRERAMKATLWRQGIARQKWYFGTVDKNGNQFPTGTNVCNAANDPNFIINIPVRDIFYDPQILTIGYTGPLAIPLTALYNANAVIDLYEVQQAVLMNQTK
ncbi:hypothetical protein GLOIN_2v1763913 [Rhizophagus clarus]|uniref:Uncharacterized protein n=1 Tax=Rhizophagus clarus TaxID=94130 RepID=A0A8H3M953_9GLOM|nr:hypothetical protein GLOIN_2v1763913 [Rhizophagus clarus]